nr:MAG TPA: hypothetical protein [Microviridae sp.]
MFFTADFSWQGLICEVIAVVISYFAGHVVGRKVGEK